MYDKDTWYKVLSKDGRACHGGSARWFLPQGKRPGKWMPGIANPVPCERGYHLVRGPQVLPWLGETLWTAEGRGEQRDQSDKSCFSQARLLAPVHSWNDTSARLFAADCAEHTLHIFLKVRPDDDRPGLAIEAARQYARGEIRAAARDAAGAAAGAAARAAAWDAARDAARDAAGAAAGDAARAAAGAAAWAAAWDAAWAAAGAAAWDTAWDTARDAAWAGAAEREWQYLCLLGYLNG